MLDAEAEEQCGAKRYERTPDRLDNRDGHYGRQLHTKAGEVSLTCLIQTSSKGGS